MSYCPKCFRKLKKVFHDVTSEDLAIESLSGEVIIGNCGNSEYDYYCENCDEYFKL